MNIVEELNKKGLTLSCAESFTGGGFANAITNISHASNCFKGGLVSYAVEIKDRLLGVSKETLEKFGTVSKECCYEMVTHCKVIFNTDIAVAFTGNAGPTASEGKPVGLIYIGIIIKDKISIQEFNLEGDRETIKKTAIEIAISQILKNI